MVWIEPGTLTSIRWGTNPHNVLIPQSCVPRL